MTKVERYALIRRICINLDRARRQEVRTNKLIKALKYMEHHSNMYWHDESSYAKKYYGDILQETTKFDKEWN